MGVGACVPVRAAVLLLCAVVSVSLLPVCTCLVALVTLTHLTPAPCRVIKGKDSTKEGQSPGRGQVQGLGLVTQVESSSLLFL